MISKQITVAVDAMGGDKAPKQNIAGAIEALKTANDNVRLILVGDEAAIKPYLSGDQSQNLLTRHAAEAIGMDEHPVQAIKKKPNSSLVVAAKMVKDGEADAFISAGNTGAATAVGLLIVGRIKGIDRPAIAATFPTKKGFSLILDVGANADCKPENLVEFAKMGTVYVRQMAGIDRPSIGLLNIGEESSKGNFLSLRAYELLKKADLNFYGNVEGRDMPLGTTDVIICDGFTGNIALKLMEGVADTVFFEIKNSISSSFRGRLGASLLMSSLKSLRERLDPDSYGGSPLLGIKGVGVIAHGSSSPKAIANAILAAALAVEQQVVAKIEEQVG